MNLRTFRVTPRTNPLSPLHEPACLLLSCLKHDSFRAFQHA